MWQRQVGVPGHTGRDARADRRRRSNASPAPAPRPGERLTSDAVSALQGSAGNAAVARMLRPARPSTVPVPVQRLRSDDEEESDDEGQPAQQPQQQAPAPNPNQVRAGITTLVDNPPMVNYGARRQGRAHGEFWMRFARSKQGEEAEETLSETSALLFDSMKGAQEQAREEDPEHTAEDSNNREVQGMLINGRLVFASNYNSSIDTLVERGRHEVGAEPTFGELLEFEQSDAALTRGLREHEAENVRAKLASFRRKNRAIVTGQRGEGEQQRGPDATAMALRAKMDSPVIVVDVEDPDLHGMLTDEEHEGRVFLLRFAALDPRAKKTGKNKGQQTQEGSVHAEQKLLLALRRAGIRPRRDVRGPISVMGKYRPCMGCAAALMYYRERLDFTNLTFDENYGHYFQGSVDSLYEHQRHVMDAHYLEYIRQMVAEDITSTPAMAHEAAPQGAVHRRGGPSLRVPGAYASRQADVTPPTSDAEFDEDDTYRRITRPLTDTWTTETASAGIGKGSATHTIPRRRHERLTPEQQTELRELWNGRPGEPPTNASRRQAIELADRYNARDQMTFEYLAKVVALHPDRFNGYVARFRDRGHWKHVPTRSKKVETGPKNRKKGAVEKQFTKGGELDQEGMDTIRAVIESLGDDAWCRDWRRADDGRSTGELNATKAPDALLRTLAELRRDHHYSVPSLSKYLHTGANGDKLRKAIQRKGEKLLARREQSETPMRTEDIEMEDAAPIKTEEAEGAEDFEMDDEPWSVPAGFAGGSSSSMTLPHRPGPSIGIGEAGSSSGTSYRDRPREIGGYTLHVDPRTGQATYIDEDTGYEYVHVDGRMVRIDRGEDEDVEMGGSRGRR
ncbi:hypothetical protein EHYA_05409 [Embleya hyalina]|uniref:Uncharacterized protein n=1 Tax=Embleya hyalina TaxID=516124 RepID=A0A401YSX6_9ACTN|nr:hypothetical protein EHYA_05409 [Embleya hyalina]